MLTNKEMKLFVMLNNVDIFLENNKAYIECKTNLSEEILSSGEIVKIKGFKGNKIIFVIILLLFSQMIFPITFTVEYILIK